MPAARRRSQGRPCARRVNAGLRSAVRQLGAAWTTADLLRDLYSDTVATAGGIIHAVCREELAFNEAQTNAEIDSIAVTTRVILDKARSRGPMPVGDKQSE